MSATRLLRQLEGRPWAVVVAVSFASFTAALSSTLIDVVIPEMMGELAMPLERAHWLASGFLLSNTVCLLVSASFIERFGIKATYQIGVAIFAIGALLGSLTSSEALLMLSRVIQGGGAGLLQPVAVVAVARVFPVDRRGFAMGIFGAGVLMGPTLGPIFGAVLVDSLGWRSTYVAQIPLAVACFGLGELLLSRDSGVAKDHWLDWKGCVLLSLAVSSLMLTLTTYAEREGGDPVVSTWAIASIFLFCFFVYQQLATAGSLVQMRLFLVPQFAVANVISFSVGFALYGSLLLIPLYLQSVLQLSATTSGLVLLPAGLLMVALSPLGGHLSDVLPPRIVVTVGMVIYSGSIAMMAAIGPMTSFLEIIIAVCVSRMALSCLLPSMYSSALKSVPDDAISQAAGIINFSRQLGGTIGVAAVAALLHGRAITSWQTLASDVDLMALRSVYGTSHAYAESLAFRNSQIWAQTFAYREVLLTAALGVLIVSLGGLLMRKQPN